MQDDIDQANADFWNELCGTGMAQSLGLTDHSLESLRRFDQAYFDYYPYLLPFVRPWRMQGQRVLEVGLGYGSLGQQIAAAGADYHGLDIAANPARMTNHRLRIVGLAGKAVQGSAHDMPFADNHFDYVVSIGCFHHTGSMRRCLDETYRVLKPGGAALLMVYNKFSWRQWFRWPAQTWRALVQDWGFAGSQAGQSAEQRRAYDYNRQGEAAPETSCLSIQDLRELLSKFERLTFRKQNCDPLIVGGKLWMDRPRLLSSLGRWLGLDIYFSARKPLVQSSARAA